jgi:hypothetical protein
MNQRSPKCNNIKGHSGCCFSDLQAILLLEMSRAKAYLWPLVGAGDGGAFWRRLPSWRHRWRAHLSLGVIILGSLGENLNSSSLELVMALSLPLPSWGRHHGELVCGCFICTPLESWLVDVKVAAREDMFVHRDGGLGNHHRVVALWGRVVAHRDFGGDVVLLVRLYGCLGQRILAGAVGVHVGATTLGELVWWPW